VFDKSAPHTGVDFGAPSETLLTAMLPGIVTQLGYNAQTGFFLIIDTPIVFGASKSLLPADSAERSILETNETTAVLDSISHPMIMAVNKIKEFISHVNNRNRPPFLRCIYMHLYDKPPVDAESIVWPGEIVGKVGSTGLSSGPHLHFETRLGSNYIMNPVLVLEHLKIN